MVMACRPNRIDYLIKIKVLIGKNKNIVENITIYNKYSNQQEAKKWQKIKKAK